MIGNRRLFPGLSGPIRTPSRASPDRLLAFLRRGGHANAELGSQSKPSILVIMVENVSFAFFQVSERVLMSTLMRFFLYPPETLKIRDTDTYGPDQAAAEDFQKLLPEAYKRQKDRWERGKGRLGNKKVELPDDVSAITTAFYPELRKFSYGLADNTLARDTATYGRKMLRRDGSECAWTAPNT